MNVDDFYASRFLSAGDLGNTTHVVQIERIESEKLNDGKVKPVLFFVGKQKALLANKTNCMTLSAVWGKDMPSWIGRSLELFSTIVQGPSGPVPGIRVRPIMQSAQPAQSAPQATTQAVF